MKHTKIIIILLLLVMALTSCHRTGYNYYKRELEKIDHRHNRELARKEAVAISKEIALQTIDLRMYHLLIIAEMNEEVKPYRNLETARKLIDYYEEYGDKQKLLRTYIIAGIIYANCNDSPKALGYFHKAEDMLADGKHPELRSKLYSKIAKLQLHHNMPDAAREHARKVLDYCQQQKDTMGMIQALMDISASYRSTPGNELANLERAYELAVEANDYIIQSEIMFAIAKSYVDNEHYLAAKPFAILLLDKLPFSEQHKVNALFGLGA